MAEEIYNGIIIHFNKVYDYDVQGCETESVLMSHPIYFLQNGVDTLINENIDELKSGYLDTQTAAKSLLLLHTLPFDYGSSKISSFFNKRGSKNVGYEIVPYGILALFGGLLYRKMYYEETGKDIISTGNIYKHPDINHTMLVTGKYGNKFGVIAKNSKKEYLPINYILSDDIDIYIKNKLIELFIKFVEETGLLLNSIELKEVITKSEGKYMNETKKFTYNSYIRFVHSLINKDILGVTKQLSNLDFVDSFKENYMAGVIKNSKLWLYYREDNMLIQNLFDKLYNHKCGVLTLVCQTGLNSDCVLSNSSYNSVLTGFSSTLKTLLSTYKKENDRIVTKDTSVSKNSADEDLKKSIYLYMKQFWDKWLCGVVNDKKRDTDPNYIKPFSVEWFNKQFLFIDTLYNDTSCSLKLNCETLVGMYNGALTSENGAGIHVLNHLANVAQEHHCNFFCYPDFIDFRKTDKNGNKEHPVRILEDLFRPIPYNNINPVEAENQFVVMRVSNSQITGNKTQFKNDGFDIWTSDDKTAIVPATFKNGNYNAEDNKLRLAYKVPAFGVAFSRQNNSLFKSIDIGMDTQQITEQSIKAMCMISQLGNNNKRAVTFYGNDIYGIYSAYSYIVTITMMGDAQIQPLMYFQLMNIPMFRGTYMVIEVKHSIKVGDFVTTFRGMKMSIVEPPINSSWFTIEPEDSDSKDGNKSNDCGGNQVNSDGTPAPQGTEK